MSSLDSSSFEVSMTIGDDDSPTDISLLDSLRLLNAAGGALATQVALHGELLRIEWAEEKRRLLNMLCILLIGFASLFCVMIFSGVLVLTLNWDGAYRIIAIIGLIAAYAFTTFLAWRRFQSLSAQSEQTFSASREEIAADLALFKRKL